MYLLDLLSALNTCVKSTTVIFKAGQSNTLIDIKNRKVSVSSFTEQYAKHWCALLLSPNSTFAQCRSVVDPEMYYKVP